MRFYHGTTNRHLESIETKGLKEPFLTTSLDLAAYYADVTSEEKGGEGIVIEVEIEDESLLRYDSNAMDEPVSFDGFTIGDLEEKRNDIWHNLSKTRPEWVRKSVGGGDLIIIPETEYTISLETVGSCWFDGIIHKQDIISIK